MLAAYDEANRTIEALAVQYSAANSAALTAAAEIERLSEANERFRDVYEQENRTTTVQVARSEEGETKVVETISVDGLVPPFLSDVVSSETRGIA